jgi:hypothetical protein
LVYRQGFANVAGRGWQKISRTDLATSITAGTLIIKNLGPESVMIDTGYGADDMRLRLRPDQARIMAVQSHIRVRTTGASPALVEFDFMPAFDFHDCVEVIIRPENESGAA